MDQDIEAPRAWGYSRGMARVLGIKLGSAVRDGLVSRNELERIVDCCQGCSAKEQCGSWLAKTVTATELPSFCPNKSSIEAIVPKL